MININKAVSYILNEVDIIEYLQEHEDVDLSKYGSNYRALCPLHEDKDPSFTITGGKNVWYCFGCGEGGSLITFIERLHDINRVSAVVSILNNLGLNVHDFIKDFVSEVDINILDSTLSFFVSKSMNNRYSQYFTNKGCEDLKVNEIRNVYKVGYATNEQELHDYLYSQGYTKDQIVDYGLYGTRFNNAIAFPIYSAYDRLVGFQFRALEGEVKYLSDRNDKYIVGLNKLKTLDYVILVEGYTEWMALHMNGFNALAMRGLNLNEDLIKLLLSYEIKKVYVWTDGDMAGLKFIHKLVHDYVGYFNKHGIDGHVIYINDNDPDELIFQGTDVQSLIDKSLLLPEYYLVRKHTTTYTGKNYQFIQHAVEICKDYSHLLLNKMIGVISQLTKIDSTIIEDSFIDACDRVNSDYLLEINVISCLLYGYKVESNIELSEDYFAYKSNKLVFNLIKLNGVTIDNIKLVATEVWINDYVEKLPPPNYDKLHERLKILKSYKIKNDLVKLSKKIVLMSNNTDECISYINDQIINMASDKSVVVQDFYDSMKSSIDRLTNGGSIMGHDISSKFPVMNRILLGIMPSKLIILMGVTGHGKTNMALNIASILSYEQDKRGMYFCGEMQVDELTSRFISIISGVSNTDIYTNNVDDADLQKIISSTVNFSANKLKFHDTMSFDKIINIIKYVYLNQGLDYVVIDYLQLLESPSHMNRKDRTYQLKEMTRILKDNVCNKLGLPVILLGQLADQAMDDATPNARRSSESKLIQADADVTIAMRMKNKKELSINPSGNIICHVDKVRYNKSNTTILLQFNDIDLTIQETQ